MLPGLDGFAFCRALHAEERTKGVPVIMVTARSVDVQIVGLRRKLGRHSELIETVRGVGYRMRTGKP